MNLTLHHINLCTDNVEEMDAFYQDVLGLNRETNDLPILEKKKGYSGDVAFVSDGNIQMHLAQRDNQAGFKTGQIVNPVARGHIAYRTDDLEAFKKHLEAKGISFVTTTSPFFALSAIQSSASSSPSCTKTLSSNGFF